MGIGGFLKKAGKFVAQAAYQPVAGLYNAGVGAVQGDWKQAKMGLGQFGKGALKAGIGIGGYLAAPAIGGALGIGGGGSAAGSGMIGGLSAAELAAGGPLVGAAMGAAPAFGTAAAGAGAAGTALSLSSKAGAVKGIGGFLKNNALDIGKIGLSAYGAQQAGSAADAELAASREQWEQQFGLDRQLADERIAQAAWERQRQEKLDEEKRARNANMDPIRGQLIQTILGNQAPTRH